MHRGWSASFEKTAFPAALAAREQLRGPRVTGKASSMTQDPDENDGYWPSDPDAQLPDDPETDPPPAPGTYPPPATRGQHRVPPSAPESYPYVVAGLVFFIVIAGISGFIAGRNTAPRASAQSRPAASVSSAAPVSSTPATSAAPATSAPATPAAPAASVTPAAPLTGAAARSAATTYFSLDAAGQYAATYALLDFQARQQVSEATWVTVHQDCKSSVPGLAFAVGTSTLSGTTAVISVAVTGQGSSLGTDHETFVYRDGRWLYAPSDLPSYQGTPAQIIARLKAAGNC